MTDPCPSCGEVLDPSDQRCPRCGTLAPPRPGSSVFAHEEAPPRWAEDPLAIPIREPGDPGVRRHRPPGGIPRPVVGALVAVAVLALVAVLAAQTLGTDGGDDLASDGSAATSAPAGPGTDGDEDVSADDTTSTSGATTTTSTTSTTSSSTTSTTTTTTTTTAPAATRPGSVPPLPSSFRGGWVAQLSSVPASAGTASVEAAYARIRSDVPGAVAARSDEWPSMAPGYWVFVETGFGSEDAVRSFCSSVGRSGDSCLPRLLSDRR